MATTRALIEEELNRRGATVSDTDVDAEFQGQYAQFLAALGMSEQELKDAFDAGELAGVEIGDLTFNQFIANTKQTVREELESQAIQRVIAGPIDHEEEQLIAFFEQHRSDYDTPEQIRVSHILVETEERAQQGLAVLGAGGIFRDLAREISIDTDTSEQGGDLGWFERGRLSAPFEYAAFATPVGEVSGIIRTEFGYHIILVTDYQPEHMPTYEDVADLVAGDFDALVVDQRFEEWYTAARVAAIISIEDLMLDAFRKQQEDVDQGLQAYLRLRDEGLVDEPYLDYIIGTIYEMKMDEAQSRRLGIASGQQEQIDAVEAEIETNRSQALASYRAALSQLEDSAEIDARIKSLESDL
ncbi:peptidylprolyl isomerase [Candidatus Bipolaricaulota bacterium]